MGAKKNFAALPREATTLQVTFTESAVNSAVASAEGVKVSVWAFQLPRTTSWAVTTDTLVPAALLLLPNVCAAVLASVGLVSNAAAPADAAASAAHCSSVRTSVM